MRMSTVARDLTLAFACGCLGVAVMFLVYGVLILTGVADAATTPGMPAYETKPFVYSRVVWGGLWALLLALPILRRRWITRGLMLAAAASLASAFHFHPFLQQAAPAFLGVILAMNAIWGLTAAAAFRWTAGRRQSIDQQGTGIQ